LAAKLRARLGGGGVPGYYDYVGLAEHVLVVTKALADLPFNGVSRDRVQRNLATDGYAETRCLAEPGTRDKGETGRVMTPAGFQYGCEFSGYQQSPRFGQAAFWCAAGHARKILRRPER
jgi:hypothetical protein